MDKDMEFDLRIDLDIEPIWISPASSIFTDCQRQQVKLYYAVRANKIEKEIRDKLNREIKLKVWEAISANP